MRGYVEERLEGELDVEGCSDCEFTFSFTGYLGMNADNQLSEDNIVSAHLSEPRLCSEFSGWCFIAGGL